jgi:hypothetical protein
MDKITIQMKIILPILLLTLYLTGCRCPTCEPTVHYSSSGKPFPTHWGKPPDIQTKDVRPLPDGYGMGSSTLNGWIIRNKEKDGQRRLNDLPSSLLLINGPDR